MIHTRASLRILSSTIATLALAACGNGGTASATLAHYSTARIESAEQLARWTTFRPKTIITAAMLHPALLERGLTSSSCPVVTEDGTTRTYRGGCTDDHGKTWTGTLTVVGPRERPEAITYDGFGSSETRACAEGRQVTTSSQLTGRVTQRRAASGAVSFTVDLTAEGDAADEGSCEVRHNTLAVEYAGTVVERDGETVWNGRGRVGSSTDGVATVESIDEVTSETVCPREPLSGRLTVTAGGRHAEVTFDGRTACDDPASAPWTLDGQAQGQVRLAGCTVGLVGAGSGALGCATALGAALALGARRRRRRA